MNIDLINACSDLGVHINGANKGPKRISKKYIDNKNINNIYDIEYKNIKKSLEVNDKEKNLTSVNDFNETLYNKIIESLSTNKIPITIGGDHSVVIASALASINKYTNLGLIWIDSHGDYNNFDTTITGNLHGLPLAAITNYKNTEKLTKFHKNNFYNPKKTVLVGARDIDPLELENLKNAGVKIYTTDDIKKYGVQNIMKISFDIVNDNTNGVHISYDLDVIDPNLAPGVSVPARNGINVDEAYQIMDEIIKNKTKIKSLDLVEYNPDKDIDSITLKIAQKLLDKFIN